MERMNEQRAHLVLVQDVSAKKRESFVRKSLAIQSMLNPQISMCFLSERVFLLKSVVNEPQNETHVM